MDEIEWGRHRPTGPTHAWERTSDDRRRSLCGHIPERWTDPTPEWVDERTYRCLHCLRVVRLLEERDSEREKLERHLGHAWPHGLTMTWIRDYIGWPAEHAARMVADLEADGLVFVYESPGGRRRITARRILVEAVGRTYGMASTARR